jgi:hypothetical protein
MIMGIVKYKTKDNGGKIFNVGQALKDGWGKDWQGEEHLIGLKLQDRKDPSHKAVIANIDWEVGTMRVWWVDGGWSCFDHAIEQFKCIS